MEYAQGRALSVKENTKNPKGNPMNELIKFCFESFWTWAGMAFLLSLILSSFLKLMNRIFEFIENLNGKGKDS